MLDRHTVERGTVYSPLLLAILPNSFEICLNVAAVH